MIIAPLFLILFALLFPGFRRILALCPLLLVGLALVHPASARADQRPRQYFGSWSLDIGENPITDAPTALMGITIVRRHIAFFAQCFEDWTTNASIAISTGEAFNTNRNYADPVVALLRFDRGDVFSINVHPVNRGGTLIYESNLDDIDKINKIFPIMGNAKRSFVLALGETAYDLPINGLAKASKEFFSTCTPSDSGETPKKTKAVMPPGFNPVHESAGTPTGS